MAWQTMKDNGRIAYPACEVHEKLITFSTMLNLKPEIVWKHFEELSDIPRCSGNEEGVRQYLLEVAREHGLQSRVDGAGNVLLSEAGEDHKPKAVLQSHIDMVCEKNSSVEHDFETDPIELTQEDGWLTAQGTTLGADNGIGVALSLAVATGSYDFGPFDYLFTVDEERGLNGAAGLDPEFLRADKLINLDSEEFGAFTVGCAGGGNTEIRLPLSYEETTAVEPVRINLSGLAGGHSGGDIDKGRANANKLLARLLDDLWETEALQLVEIRGGDKHNAIPRESTALVNIAGDPGNFEEQARERFSVLQKEYEETEENMALRVEVDPGVVDEVMTEESGRTAVGLLRALPNGVMAYDQKFESTVETSSNLASVGMEGRQLRILVSSRSSRGSKLESLRGRISIIARAFGAAVEQDEAYPAWQPDMDSKLLAEAETVFEELYGRSPEVRTIHGGLETGIIGEKVDGIEMLAVGPDIVNPHSPDERVKVDSVRMFWEFLLKLLGSFA